MSFRDTRRALEREQAMVAVSADGRRALVARRPGDPSAWRPCWPVELWDTEADEILVHTSLSSFDAVVEAVWFDGDRPMVRWSYVMGDMIPTVETRELVGHELRSAGWS